jgi:hypothetical protein
MCKVIAVQTVYRDYSPTLYILTRVLFQISYTHSVTETIVAGGLQGPQTTKTETSKLWVSTPNDIKEGLLALVKCAINRPSFFAQSLNASMAVSKTAVLLL